MPHTSLSSRSWFLKVQKVAEEAHQICSGFLDQGCQLLMCLFKVSLGLGLDLRALGLLHQVLAIVSHGLKILTEQALQTRLLCLSPNQSPFQATDSDEQDNHRKQLHDDGSENVALEQCCNVAVLGIYPGLDGDRAIYASSSPPLSGDAEHGKSRGAEIMLE